MNICKLVYELYISLVGCCTRYHQQISEVEESYKKKITDLEQKLRDSLSEGELSGRRLQSDLEAKFEYEKSQVVLEWKKRWELLEVELRKEKERASKEERKTCESHGFLKNEISKKDLELEKLRQVRGHFETCGRLIELILQTTDY